MTTSLSLFAGLSDDALLGRVSELAARERRVTVELVASLAELDARRLYLGLGCSSLYTYCTHVLHLSEHAAYGRIEAARAARRFPQILDHLAAGELTLTAVCLLAPVLTPQNHRELLNEARHESKRDVEQIVVRVRPQPAVPSTVRKLPPRQSAAQPAPTVIAALGNQSHADERPEPIGPSELNVRPVPPPPARRPVVRPLAPEIYKVQFTLSREGHEKLQRVQDLLRHTLPSGDPAVIFERALTLLLEDVEKKKLASTSRPRDARRCSPGSRHIPAAVTRAVQERDGGQCAFVGTHGRCTERGFLQYHHVVPFADRGQATVENIQLRCAAHNAHEADVWFRGSKPSLLREMPPPYGAQLGPDRVRTPAPASP